MTAAKLCVVLLLSLCSLTACGEKKDVRSGVVYIPQEVKFSSPLDHTDSACISGETVYLLGTIRDLDTFTDTLTLVRIPLEGGKAEELPGFLPTQFEDGGEYSSISGYLRLGQDGTLWLTENVYSPDHGGFLVLRQLDSEGNELFSFNGSELKTYLGVETIHDLWTDGAGTVFVNTGEAVVLLDENLAVRATLEGKDLGWRRFLTLPDGHIAIPDVEQGIEGGILLRVIAPEAGDWAEESFSLPYGVYGIQPGEGNVLFYYISGDALYAWRKGAQEGERMMSWAESGVDPNYMSAFAFLPDGRLASITGAVSGVDSKVQLALLTATDASSLPERTVLELATLYFDGKLRAAVADFNSTSKSCFISVTEYMPQGSGYDTELQEQAGLRMATALMAGKVPDIILLSGQDLPIRRMEAQGMLEDLWPYIDADPELGRDALMTRPLEALEYEGGLYYLSNSFSIDTIVGAKSVVGDRMTWTYDDFWEALESMPEGSTATGEGRCDSKSAMLEMLARYSAPRFLDLEAGTSNFNGEEFRTLLEFCNRFPDEPPEPENPGPFAALYYGEQMLDISGVNHFVHLQQTKALIGEEISFVGWPNEGGRPGSSFTLTGLPLAIPSASPHKEEAWSFLREQLLPSEEVSLKNEMSSGNHFPVNRADFERMAEMAMTPKMGAPRGVSQEVPQDAIFIPGVDEPVYYYAMTQEEYDQFMALYNAAEGTCDYDANLMNIITEQAGAYFAGDRSLDDTVAAIQSRVGLYLAELEAVFISV